MDTLETLTTSDALKNATESLNTTATSEETAINTVPSLSAAGPEPTDTITADQTKTETGPALWIALLLAFALASAWNAWKKQVAK